MPQHTRADSCAFLTQCIEDLDSRFRNVTRVTAPTRHRRTDGQPSKSDLRWYWHWDGEKLFGRSIYTRSGMGMPRSRNNQSRDGGPPTASSSLQTTNEVETDTSTEPPNLLRPKSAAAPRRTRSEGRVPSCAACHTATVSYTHLTLPTILLV